MESGKEQKVVLEDRKMAILTIIDIIKSKRHFFYLTICLTVIGTLTGHFLKQDTFETQASLFVQNIDQPSAAEYLLNQHVYKLSRVDRIESYVNHLNSDSFLLKVAEKIKFSNEYGTLNIVSPQRKSKLGLAYWKHAVLSKEDDSITSSKEKKLLVPVERIAGFLRKVVSVHSDYNSQFINIRVKSLDPQTSKYVANLIAQEFVSITNRHSLNEVKEIESFVQDKKTQAEIKVRSLDKELIKFKRQNNIVSTDATTREYASRLARLEAQIEAAKIEQAEKSKLLAEFSKGRERALSKIFRDGSKTQDFASEETAYILQNKIDKLKMEKSAYIAEGYKESSWQIQKINKDIDQQVVRLKSVVNDPGRSFSSLDTEKAREKIDTIKDALQTINAKVATLKKARVDLQTQVERLPNLQQEYIKLENQFKMEIENLANLERKEKELEIQRISYKKEVRVDQLAELPGPAPRGSLFLKLIFSTLAALFMGLLIVLGLESLDPTVKSRQDIFDCGLDFLGEVPLVVNEDKPKKRPGRVQFGSPDDLVCKNKPESVESMSFKYMRARIESMRYKEKKDSQVITFSSALHNEGKSFVTANMAISLAQLKRKVVLIDADLRRPSQPAYFGFTTKSGLTDLLSMKKDLDEVLIKDQYPNLHIIPAGFSGLESTELISSQKFRLLIEHLRQHYEYIVIDTPPTFAVVDSAIISSFSDIPILVSSYRESRKADLYEAYNDLLQVSYKNVYGVINKAVVSNSRIHYYGYPMYDDKNAPEIGAFSSSDEDDAEEFVKKLNKKTS